MQALLSVSDKRGIVELASNLLANGYTLLSTGGTLDTLRANGIQATPIADYTGQPEMLDGRVKTLHPKIHAAILADVHNPRHSEQLRQANWEPIAMVVVNLYPFRATVANPEHTLVEALDKIDIGGPTLLRAAAKNYPLVTVVCDPDDYGMVSEQIAQGGIAPHIRRTMARKAFEHVADYDAAVANYLAVGKTTDQWERSMLLNFKRVATPKYGENPHQSAAVYSTAAANAVGVANAELVHGHGLSYLNYLDADAAYRAAGTFGENTVAVVKHASPCGLATAAEQTRALELALEGDPESTYGGVLGFNRPLTASTAKALRGKFLDVLIAPDFTAEALDILCSRKKLRLMRVKPCGASPDVRLTSISGGILIQQGDTKPDDPSSWTTPTKRIPSAAEKQQLEFAWRVCRLVRSNAIVLARENAVVGIGAGQPSRLRSVDIAVGVAGDRAQGAVMASDAFFPFADGVERAVAAGVAAIIQPGGSIRDTEVVKAADQHGIAMLFTARRSFLH